jgi:leucine-rich repeat-containing protein 49
VTPEQPARDKPLDPEDEEDERYKYLMTHGIVRKMEGNDNIIFAELMRIPGALVVYRKPSERNKNYDKLILQNMGLTVLPLLEGEEKLKMLNLQGNKIAKIENLVSLHSLVYLDLYDN